MATHSLNLTSIHRVQILTRFNFIISSTVWFSRNLHHIIDKYLALLLEKLVNRKHFSVKEKFSLVFRKVFSFYFEPKTLSISCEKIRNIVLFADYIKFGHKLLIAIYFVLIFFFNSSLRI